MRYSNNIEAIGNTPHICLPKLFPNHEVYMKMEKQNPGGSIKDRIALSMIEDAENKGILKQGSTIIEPTSGNTGIGLAWIGKLKGYRVILTMPESMSKERQQLMKVYGAEIVLTPGSLGMQGAIEKADELYKTIENSFIPQQFKNQANPDVHKRTTAKEIVNNFPEGFDYFVTGIGTGGHISGIGEVLKEKFPQIQIFGVEPSESPVLSGGKPNPHALQGIGAGFIPQTLNRDILDGIISIEKAEAYTYTKELIDKEGILAGISTGASLAAIRKITKNLTQKAKILTIGCDTGERYLSVEGLF